MERLICQWGLLQEMDIIKEGQIHPTTNKYLGTRIGDIKVVKSNVLDNLLLFMNISLGQRNILFCLEIVFSGICIASANALDFHKNQIIMAVNKKKKQDEEGFE